LEKIKISKRTYTDYNEKCSQWKFYLNSYKGGKSFVSMALNKYFREIDEQFKRRKESGYYLNYCKMVIDTIVKFVYSNPDEIKIEIPEKIKFILEDCDRNGTAIINFDSDVMRLGSIYGQVYIGVDVPIVDRQPETLAEQLESNYRPYLYTILPDKIKDYSVAENGELNWIIVEELYIDDINPFAPRIVEHRYKVWYTDRWELWKSGKDANDDDILIAEGSHSFGRVPIVKFIPADIDNDGCGESLLRDIANINAEILNISSSINQEFFEQLFPLLLAPRDSCETDVNGKPVINLSSGAPLLFQDIKPEYITPGVAAVVQKMSYIDMLRLEILRISGLSNISKKDQSFSQESGISKALDFVQTNEMLSRVAEKKAEHLRKILRLLAHSYGISAEEINVVYPKDFNIYTEQDELDRLQLLLSMDISKTFNDKLKTHTVDRILGSALNEAEYKQIEKEIAEKSANTYGASFKTLNKNQIEV